MKIDPRAEEALESREAYLEIEAERQASLKKPMDFPECDECEERFKCFTERDGHKKDKVTRGTGKCLAGWKNNILKEMPYVDIKPYSHNIISLSLSAIARGWGDDEAGKVMDEFGLENLGWQGK